MAEPCSDSQLMRRVSQGDRDDFETLVRRYADSLLAFLLRMLSDHHRAEEVFQDVFLAVWARRHSYQYPRPFKPWLYKIAMNRCRETFRKARLPTDSTSDVAELRDAEGSAATTAVHRETVARLDQAVKALPARQQTVVALRVWSELSYAEIAQVVGLREATVRSHMHHALASLRIQMKTYLSD